VSRGIGLSGSDREYQALTDRSGTQRARQCDLISLSSVPGLIAAGEIWNSGTLVALLRLLAAGR
jgi:hypothetical protein